MALVLSTVHNIIIVVCFHLTYQGAGKTFDLLPFSYGGKKKRLNVILVYEITWEHWCAKDSCFGVQVLLSKWLCMEVRDAENLIWFFFFLFTDITMMETWSAKCKARGLSTNLSATWKLWLDTARQSWIGWLQNVSKRNWPRCSFTALLSQLQQ